MYWGKVIVTSAYLFAIFAVALVGSGLVVAMGYSPDDVGMTTFFLTWFLAFLFSFGTFRRWMKEQF